MKPANFLSLPEPSEVQIFSQPTRQDTKKRLYVAEPLVTAGRCRQWKGVEKNSFLELTQGSSPDY